MNTEENVVAIIREKYQALKSILNERQRRLWAAMEAKVLGHGGQTLVQKATGLSRRTLYVGLQELKHFPIVKTQRLRVVAIMVVDANV